MPEPKVRLTDEELALHHDVLCAETIGDGPCTCLVHWVKALQAEVDQHRQMASRVTEPCSCPEFCVYHARKNFDDLKADVAKLRLERRGFQVMARKMVDHLSWHSALENGRYERAGGDVLCKECRVMFSEHPQLPGLPTFHMLCNGDIVKT